MTPEQMRDASLLELFSLEAEAQTQVLSAGLLALERDPTLADQLESCMRAAHSLKGAARIVGVDAGVSVAHVMEDCLVSAQEGRLSLVELLGLDGTGNVAPGARVMPRMLIIAAHGGPVVVPVDEVDGIHAIDEHILDSASRSGAQASARYTRGVLQFKGRSLRWLDEEQLLSAVTRSLT